jgi:RNA polymerase sigma-70 factor, ECF subfamily
LRTIDMNALLSLIGAEIPRLRRYALALLRDSDSADDLVQDTLLRALERSQLWEAGTNLRAWLFTIMHNNYVNGVRRSVRQGKKVNPEHVALAVAPAQVWSLMLRDLDLALARLPDEQRSTVWLIGVDGMTYEETAQISAVPIGTVRSRLCRARERMRALLDGDDDVPDAGASDGSAIAALSQRESRAAAARGRNA